MYVKEPFVAYLRSKRFLIHISSYVVSERNKTKVFKISKGSITISSPSNRCMDQLRQFFQRVDAKRRLQANIYQLTFRGSCKKFVASTLSRCYSQRGGP